MDWTGSYDVSFSYMLVDPLSWADDQEIGAVASCAITRDLDMETLEQATFEIADADDGERWIRCYADVGQDGISERVCLGTFLVQTPRRSDDGKFSKLDCTAYSSLHVLAEAKPNAGYALARGSNCVDAARQICEQHGMAPVVYAESDRVLDDHYVAPSDASWLDIAKTLLAAAGMKVETSPWGEVVFAPDVPGYALSPTWTFRDDETSILLPEVSEERDWYGLPNVCVVTTPSGIVGRAENADPTSRISTAYRGREVTLKIDDPDELRAGCSQEIADAYALRMLREASCIERSATIRHGYCPARAGDVVTVNAPDMSLNMDALVKRQEVELSTAFTVTSTLAVREELWDGKL